MNAVQRMLPPKNKVYLPFLSHSWPGSILPWSEQDLENFAECVTPLVVKADTEISSTDPQFFFIIVEGDIDIHAVLPTIRKKTDNIREFVCKKHAGDMVYMPSIRKLIAKSNANDMYERENVETKNHYDHKNIIDVIDTVSIRSTAISTTILQLDWTLFDKMFPSEGVLSTLLTNVSLSTDRSSLSPKSNRKLSNSKLDVAMLRTIMQTNLSDYLEAVPILDSLPHSKRETVARLCHYKVVKDGDVLCREGDPGEDVFILIHGEVKVEAKVSKRVVELLQEEELLLSPLAQPPHTELSMTKSASKHNFDCGLRSHNESSRMNSPSNSEEKTNMRRKASVHYQCDYYPTSVGRGNKLISRAMKTFLHRRQTLAQLRDDCRRESAITATKTKNEDPYEDFLNPRHIVELARFEPGDFFGEISTFLDLPRTATVTATKHSLLASLSKTNFKTLYHVISPHIEVDIEHSVKEHMLYGLLQSKSPFLGIETMNTFQVKKMARLLAIMTVPENTVVFHEGDLADKFYFVYSGQLVVEKAIRNCNKQLQPTTLAMLFSGDYFGEIAILNDSKRVATVSTKSKSVLLALTREHFHQCFQETPDLITEFIIRIKGQNVDLASILLYPKLRSLFGEYLGLAKRKSYLECYNDVVALESDWKNDWKQEQLINESNRIVETYLKKRGSCPVDIPASAVKRTIETVLKMITSCTDESNNVVSDDTSASSELLSKFPFHELKEEIFQVMNNELFPRFKKWEPFGQMMERIRAYDDLEIILMA